MTTVDVCVIAYDTDPALLAQCIESIKCQFTSATVEIHVRDNSRSELLKSKFEHLVAGWIPADNDGFASAANDLVHRSSADVVLLLNPDAYLEIGTLQVMVDEVEDDPKAVYCGWLLKSTNVQVDAYMHWWSSISRLLRRRNYRRYLERESVRDRVSVQKCSGGALVGRASLLRELGPFDERFFLYGEDADFSLRARRQGLGLYALPSARVGHAAASSQIRHSPLVESARADAALRLNSYHLPLPAALVLRLELALVTLAGLLPGIRTSSHGRAGRLARLSVLRYWGLGRDRPKFSPELRGPGSRRRRKKTR